MHLFYGNGKKLKDFVNVLSIGSVFCYHNGVSLIGIMFPFHKKMMHTAMSVLILLPGLIYPIAGKMPL